MLFWDIYLILVNPFIPRRKRFFSYFLFILMVISTVILTTESQRDLYFFPKNDNDFDTKIRQWGTIGLFVIALPPMILLIKRIFTQGTGKELRQKVVRRHLWYNLVYLIFLIS